MLNLPHLCSDSLLADLSSVLQTLNNLLGDGEEGRVGGLDGVGEAVGAELLGHALLDGQRNGLVLRAEEEHGVNLVPGLVGDDVVEDGRGLVLQEGDGLGLELRLDVVVEDLLGSEGVDVVALQEH